MKDIDKMSSNELRAEVRVLRAVYEAAKELNKIIDIRLLDMHPIIVARNETIVRVIAAVEAQDECLPHDFVNQGDGTAKCADCGELADVTETGAAR